MCAFILKYTFQFMISKTDKFSNFLNILKSIDPIIPNNTPRLVPKPTSSCTEHMRQYPANFLVTNRGLWLPLPHKFFGLSLWTYFKSHYSEYTNVPNSALLNVSFPNQISSSKCLTHIFKTSSLLKF